MVGVNAFQVEENLELERVAVDPRIEQGQRAMLAEIRTCRDGERVDELLAHLEQASRGRENLMPLLITCVEASITLGEVCGVLRKVWGEYRAPSWG